MNILLLTDGVTPFVTGGMQRHSANLAKYFTLAGANVTLVHCVGFDDFEPSDRIVNKAIFDNDLEKLFNIVTLKFPQKGKFIGHYVRNSYQYSKIIYNSLDFSDIDFVYAKGFCGWYYIKQKRKGVRLPPIGVNFHGYEMYQKKVSIKEHLKALLLKKATRYNNENADYIFSYGGKITALILSVFNVNRNNVFDFPSGINNDWIRLSEIVTGDDKVKFVFVGRDEVRKGIKELNKVITKLASKNAFEFHFVGPINETNKLREANIIYHGEIKEKEKLISILDKMDVLVCPSHSEGMPNVILEGMARGLAVLATDVGAVEFIVDETNGRIIEALNQDELDGALSYFSVIDRTTLQLLKLSSINKVKKFYLWDVIGHDILKEIKTILN